MRYLQNTYNPFWKQVKHMLTVLFELMWKLLGNIKHSIRSSRTFPTHTIWVHEIWWGNEWDMQKSFRIDRVCIETKSFELNFMINLCSIKVIPFSMLLKYLPQFVRWPPEILDLSRSYLCYPPEVAILKIEQRHQKRLAFYGNFKDWLLSSEQTGFTQFCKYIY